MKLLHTTAAALTLAATGALAESHVTANNDMSATANAETEMAMSDAELIRSRDITGGVIYTMNEANDEGWDAETVYGEVGAEWNEIGEIEDIVLTSSGQMAGVVAEIGGFLDIADKHVMIETSDVSLVAVDDQTYALVTRLSEEQLEEMQAVDEAFWN